MICPLRKRMSALEKSCAAASWLDSCGAATFSFARVEARGKHGGYGHLGLDPEMIHKLMRLLFRDNVAGELGSYLRELPAEGRAGSEARQNAAPARGPEPHRRRNGDCGEPASVNRRLGNRPAERPLFDSSSANITFDAWLFGDPSCRASCCGAHRLSRDKQRASLRAQTDGFGFLPFVVSDPSLWHFWGWPWKCSLHQTVSRRELANAACETEHTPCRCVWQKKPSSADLLAVGGVRFHFPLLPPNTHGQQGNGDGKEAEDEPR